MKNNLRLVLYALAGGLAFILWQNWQQANRELSQQNQSVNQDIPVEAKSSQNDIPQSAGINEHNLLNDKKSDYSAGFVKVKTDLLDLLIDLQGGTISNASLLNYPQSTKNRQPLALLHKNNPARMMLQSGIASDDQSSPNHYAKFTAKNNEFILKDGQDKLVVPIFWQNDQGVKVIKTYTFTRGHYDFSLNQKIENDSKNNWQGFAYQQILFGQAMSSGGIGHIYTFTGAVASTPKDNYQKINLDEIRKNNWQANSNGGWIAMIQHYFLAAFIPNPGSSNSFSTRFHNGDHIISMASPKILLASGQSHEFDSRVYLGPKIQSKLKSLAPFLDKTVDYGLFFIISQPMFYILDFIHNLIGNWGFAIVIMTLMIKIIFFMPSAWAYKSMAKMRKLAPQLQKLKDRFGDDRQAMHQAMMKLYRDEKVNPASGCLPMLLQIPFFLSFYWVLVESVELRQAPFVGWISDLSDKDPYFILPILNAILMFIQQKLNPPPTDPMQQKVMMMLPIIFGLFFLFFPSGLVLYWTVSNAFSIVQQAIMNKKYGDKSAVNKS